VDAIVFPTIQLWATTVPGLAYKVIPFDAQWLNVLFAIR
jgi:hypothetical protein